MANNFNEQECQRLLREIDKNGHASCPYCQRNTVTITHTESRPLLHPARMRSGVPGSAGSGGVARGAGV